MSVRPAISLAILLLPLAAVRADVLHLSGGGKIVGTVQNPDEYPRTSYVIDTPAGVRLTLSADQVKHMVIPTPQEQEYERLRRRVPDTADGHWKLAQWCTERRMLVDREHHLQKVIEHDPTHAEARQLLGYQLKDGKWQTRADIMQSRGYEYYEGSWRTPQDIAIREATKAREEAELQWKIDLKRWRDALTGNNPARAAEAQQQILAATDPHAAPALVDLLAGEALVPVRKLLVDALAGNASGTATAALMELAIKDPDGEIRDRATTAILKRKDPSMVRQLAKALKSNDNVEVNRAAALLSALGYDSAISPLIDALVTKHRFKIDGGPPGQIGVGFGRGPGGRSGGFSFGGGGPKVLEQAAENYEVLSALVDLSGGQNFEYNPRAWRAWYANTLRVDADNLRRD